MNSKSRPAWREPMFWLVIGLPVAAVIGSIWLVIVAVGVRNDGVADDVQRTGQMQTVDLGPDARAAEQHLVAVLQAADGQLRVLAAEGEFNREQPVWLTLLHPLHSEQDRRIELQPDAIGWQATGELDDSHDWLLQLSDKDDHWRLRGRLPKGQHAARLAASVDAP